jgi:hypothetical protein
MMYYFFQINKNKFSIQKLVNFSSFRPQSDCIFNNSLMVSQRLQYRLRVFCGRIYAILVYNKEIPGHSLL